jgi:hypothetical protein
VRGGWDAGHVGESHGGVELDVARDATPALPLAAAVGRHGGSSRGDLGIRSRQLGWV